MSKSGTNRSMMIFSIVERGKGKAYMEMLKGKNIGFNFQTVGFGTAPSEMMDIFGLGSNDKDIIFSYATEKAVANYLLDYEKSIGSSFRYRGLAMVLSFGAMSRVASQLIAGGVNDTEEKGAETVEKNEQKHSLIIITLNQGYVDEVMEEAKKYGATGGTVIKARLADAESAGDLVGVDIAEEKEIVTILAPNSICGMIMENVNKKFGMRTDAKGVVCSLPVDKAFKI